MTRGHAESAAYRRKVHDLLLFAAAHHEVITSDELLGHGLSETSIRRWVRSGRLFRKHRGVYAVGRTSLTAKGRAYAAVRASGAGAAVSGRCAAIVRDLLLVAMPAQIEVVVPGTGARPVRGIRRRSSTTLAPGDVSEVEGIPCTTVARTLVDLGDREAERIVEQAWARAELLRVFDRRAVEDAARRAGTTRGARIARGLLASAATPPLTDTEIEEFLLAEVRPALKPPECQRWITFDDGGPAIRADFLWPAERLVVEADGGAAHMTRRAFEDDRRRDQRLAAAGYTVVRFTWRQLSDDPDNVRRVVRQLLARLAPQ